jgi:hypothetical protein
MKAKSTMNISNNNTLERLLAPELREIWGVLVAIALLIFCLLLLPADLTKMFIKENGPVEMVTAAGFLTAAGWLFLKRWQGEESSYFSAGALVLLLGLRELDFHARFTTMGIFKTRYYISPEVPLAEKLVVSVIVIVISIVAIRYMRQKYSSFLEGFRQRSLPAMAIFLAGCSAVLSKSLDSFSGPIEWLISLFRNDISGMALQVMEESIELAIPAFILIAIYSSSPSDK